MFKLIGAAIAIIVVLIFCMAGCERVNVGYVGIKINLAGSDRGAEDIPTVSGWVFYNPLTSTVLEYPTFVQTAVWTAKNQEGNEEISFNSREGMIFTGDFSLSYRLRPDKVPEFYGMFRSDDLSQFTHGFLRNVARDQINEIAGKMSVEEIYGPNKEELLKQAKARINKEVESIGVHLEQFGFIGAPRPPGNVVAALNAKVAATQQAMQRENELRTATAQAQIKVAEAKGEAESKTTQAKGDADSQIIRAEGEAKANRLLTESINGNLIAWRQLENTKYAIQKWNGARPMIEGGTGAGMMFQIPLVK